MIRNRHSAMLLAIVAAVVEHGAAASGVPFQEPAATASASGLSTSGAALHGHVARATSKSVLLARSAPPAADPEIRHSVLMAGRPAGLQTGRRSDDGALHFVFAYNDRGRGPSLTARVVLGSGGIPRSIETDGHDYYKNKVRDRFAIRDGKASWQNSAEQGTGELPPGTPTFYLSFNSVPAELGLLAQALLAAPDNTLPILPAGKAAIERVGKLEVKSGAEVRSVTHYEISGLSYTPIPVWLDDDGALFARGSEWSMVIREAWESAAQPLLVEQSHRADAMRCAMG